MCGAAAPQGWLAQPLPSPAQAQSHGAHEPCTVLCRAAPMAGGWSLRPRELSSVTCVLKYLSFELCLCKSSFIFLFHGAFILQLSINKKCFVYMSTSCFMHVEIYAFFMVYFSFLKHCAYVCIYAHIYVVCVPSFICAFPQH